MIPTITNIALLTSLATTILASPIEIGETLAPRDQGWSLYFWSDAGCDNDRQTGSGSGPSACQATTDVMCMSGEVDEKGFLAGGLNACIYTGPGCTGDSAGFNDAAGAQPVNIWTSATGFEAVQSWQVTESAC